MITHESSLERITEQFEYVLEKYVPHGYRAENFSNVVLGGLGGSGIGAKIAKTWMFDKAKLPIEVVDHYDLPSFADEKSLVVLNSYSGNTEETIALFHQAKAKNCAIICLSSGGSLAELSRESGIILYTLPEGYQPRMTIGFGLGTLLLIIGEFFGLDVRPEIERVIERFPERREAQIASAKQIFNFFKSSLKNKFVIIADRNYKEVATRFTQQLNENSKLEGFVNVIPECNHNVLESYTDKLDSNFIMIYSEENERVSARFDFVISHLEMENNKVLPLLIPEHSLYSIFDVIYRLDWVTVMIANELGANLMEVPNISNLKDFLNNFELLEGDE